MKEALETFLLYLATERGLSTNYQLSTRASLERFFSWLQSTSEIDRLDLITPAHLQDFLKTETERGLVTTSLKLEVVALRIFFRFLCARNILSHDPAEQLPLPKLPHSLPQPLSSQAIQKLLAAPFGLESFFRFVNVTGRMVF